MPDYTLDIGDTIVLSMMTLYMILAALMEKLNWKVGHETSFILIICMVFALITWKGGYEEFN